jgi:hypothetical protein
MDLSKKDGELLIQNNHAKIEELYANKIYPYSISKLNIIDGCHREAYYTYKDEEAKKHKCRSIYGIMGGEIHEVLEDIYNDRATADNLLPALQRELEDASVAGIDFPKDFKGGTSIRDSWVADMTHFCKNFESLEGDKFSTEELVLLKINDRRYLRGYVDLIQVVDEENKVIDIYDFKTSAMFKKEDLKHHGRQLVVYGMAKEQEGYTIRNLAWIMLKYIEVTYKGYKRVNSKDKSTISKVIQRGKLAKTLLPVVESMLAEQGYDEITSDIILSQFVEANSMDVLPFEIQKEFKIQQYIQQYEYNDELKEEAIDYINKQADIFEELWKQDIGGWKPIQIDKSNSFYCNNLCSFRNICDEVRKYNILFDLNKQDDQDLF